MSHMKGLDRRAFLKSAGATAVLGAVADGLTEDQAAQRIRLDQYSDWDRYEDWFPMNVRGVYRWVAAGGA